LTQWIGSPKFELLGMCLPALAKSIVVVFKTLMANLHYLSHRSRLLRYVSWYLMSSAGWQDVAVIDMSSL
jgi:hypothetical protein